VDVLELTVPTHPHQRVEFQPIHTSGLSSNPPTPAVDSRKAGQYLRLHIQFYKLLVMGGKTARNM
jgi:hypothetical protein